MNDTKVCTTAAMVVAAACFLSARADAAFVEWTIDQTQSSLSLAVPDTLVNYNGTNITIRLRNQSGGDGGPWNVGNAAAITGSLLSNYREAGGHTIEFLPSGIGVTTGVNSGNYRPNPAAFNPANTNAENPDGQFSNTTTAPGVFGARARASISIITQDAGFFSIRDVSYNLTSAVLPVSGLSGGTFSASGTNFGILDSTIAIDGLSVIIVGQPIPDGFQKLDNLIAANIAISSATVANLGGANRSVSIPINIPIVFDFDGNLLTGTATGTIVATAVIPERVWNVDAGGNWSTNANWVGGSPNGADLIAVFGSVITAPRSVTVDAPKTIGGMVFDNSQPYTIAGSSTLSISNTSGVGSFDVLNGSHTISAPLAIAAGNTVIKDGPGQLTISGPQTHGAGAVLTTAAGTTNIDSDGGVNLSINANATTNFGATQHLAGLNVGPGVTTTLAAGGGKLLATNTLSLDATSTLQLNDNDLVVLATSATRAAVLADVTSKVAAAFHGGLWDQPGITSSATGDVGRRTTLGAILNDNGAGQPIYTTFDGQTVDANSVLVKYTYYGDANLNGVVDGTDYALIDNGFNLLLSGWLNGDFNYDGQIDGTDYAFMDNAFNFQSGPLSVGNIHGLAGGNSLQAVPEPGSIALLAMGALAMLIQIARRGGNFRCGLMSWPGRTGMTKLASPHGRMTGMWRSQVTFRQWMWLLIILVALALLTSFLPHVE